MAKAYSLKEIKIADPPALILVDEADRLRMASLERVRAIFDAGDIGMILVGMPGIEKRLARYPQFYSRIGFGTRVSAARRERGSRPFRERLGASGRESSRAATRFRSSRGDYPNDGRQLPIAESPASTNRKNS